jgi:hypothetical protein
MDNSEGRLQDFREYIERLFLQDPEIFAFDLAVKNCPPVASFNSELKTVRLNPEEILWICWRPSWKSTHGTFYSFKTKMQNLFG